MLTPEALYKQMRQKTFIIAGPNVIESEEHVMQMAAAIKDIAERFDVLFIFKASFDKANRTSAESYRGVSLEAARSIFTRVRTELNVPIITDVHEPHQCAAMASCVDVLQIPAFLCRQTDLIVAAAKTGLVLHIKKGQFCHADAMQKTVQKAVAAGNELCVLCERGSFFGYQDVVVDPRNLIRLRGEKNLVSMDITHCLQQPAQKSSDGIVKCGGERYLIPSMGKMAMALDVHGIFLETHDRPNESKCDAPTQWPLDRLEWLLSYIGCPFKTAPSETLLKKHDIMSQHDGEDVAMYSDTMDDMGVQGRIISKLKWNKEGVRFCGRTRTLLLEEGEFDDENVRAGLGFVESLSHGDVLIIKGSKKYAYFGELMSRLSMRAGLSGVIVDGATRDTAWTTTRECTIPVGSFSITPVDIRGRGRMKEVDVPIDISTDDSPSSPQLKVFPGDFVFADRDGVAIVPTEIESSVKVAVQKMVQKEVEIKLRISKNEAISNILDCHGDF